MFKLATLMLRPVIVMPLSGPAERGCQVISTDYVSALLQRGAERARAKRMDLKRDLIE